MHVSDIYKSMKCCSWKNQITDTQRHISFTFTVIFWDSLYVGISMIRDIIIVYGYCSQCVLQYAMRSTLVVIY